MKRERIAKRFHVVVSSFPGVVRSMYADTEVTSDDEHTYVEPKSETSSQSEVPQKSASTQCSAWTHWVAFKKPYIAGVDKERAVKRSDDRETVLYVCLELKCSRAVEIVVGLSCRRRIASRTYRSDSESTDRVSAADIELLGIRHLRRVAVGVCRTCRHPSDKPMLTGEPPVIDQLGLPFDKLRERSAEQTFLAVYPTRFINSPENVSGFLRGELPVDAVVGVEHTVVDISVHNLRIISTVLS